MSTRLGPSAPSAPVALATPAASSARGRWLAPWLALAVALAAAPWLFPGGLALNLLTQAGIAIIACLSYNLLLGQGGMLSFGHAVYTGLGAYAAIHALAALGRASAAGALPGPGPLWVAVLPLVGGLGGLAAAALLGALSTRRAGTPLAMITLGLGELVYAAAQMFPAWSGGDAGVSANRVLGAPWGGWSFGPAGQVYALVAVYTLVSTAALYALTRTPFGLALRAVRDHATRAAFLGYDPRAVRYRAFLVAGFFAGLAGGLAALHLERVGTEALGAARSGAYLLFTFVGGVSVFWGPILGALLMVLALGAWAALSPAWELYLGLLFVAMVIAAPHGLAGLALAAWRRRGWAWARRRALALPLLAGALAAALAAAGGGALVEMLYARQTLGGPDAVAPWLGVRWPVGQGASWFSAAALLTLGVALGLWARRLARARLAAAPVPGQP